MQASASRSPSPSPCIAVADTDQRPPPTVLFLCTGNSARSILAEAVLNAAADGRVRGLSAGSHPVGKVHPAALALLESRQIPTVGLRSKSWDELADAVDIDIVVTVCDAAAGESCPAFSGSGVRVHWGIPDPAAAAPAQQRDAFEAAYNTLAARIDALLALPLQTMSDAARRIALQEIAGTARGAGMQHHTDRQQP